MPGAYQKINDTVYLLSGDIKLVLSVTLSSVKNDKVYQYHSEFEYMLKGRRSISIKREAVSMLQFKVSSNQNSDVGILPNHFDKFYQTLVQATKWFDGSIRTFGTRNNRLFVMQSEQTAPLLVRELVQDKWISLEPIIILDPNNIYSPGIRLCLNSPSCAIDLSVEKFYGLVHVLTGFNMYMATSLLLNYVNTCSPGTNLIQLGNNNQVEDGDVAGITGRKIGKKPGSFFDQE